MTIRLEYSTYLCPIKILTHAQVITQFLIFQVIRVLEHFYVRALKMDYVIS